MDYERYETSMYGYWDRSRRIISQIEQCRHQLFYAAYELRCAIEAFLYDYLHFLREGESSNKLKKLYSAKDLKIAILKIDPHFERRIEFDNLMHEGMGLDHIRIPSPDLTQLSNLYGRLGGYMHIQKNEMNITEWTEFEMLVKEAQTFLHDLTHPQKARVELTVEGLKLFEEFKAGTKAAPQIVKTIKRNLKKYVAGTRIEFDA
jgi:hypothetical protein